MTATVFVRDANQDPPPMRTDAQRTVPLHALGGSGVRGTAVFRYNAARGWTPVLLTMQGLRPGSVHPVHLHAGSNRTANVPILAAFEPVSGMGRGMGMAPRADHPGTPRGRATFTGSASGKTWHINVHTGPGLATMAQFQVLTCGVPR